MSDIVERLRERASSLRGLGAIAHPDADTDDAAAAEITTLRAENERMRGIIQRVYQMSNQREVIELTRAALEASDE